MKNPKKMWIARDKKYDVSYVFLYDNERAAKLLSDDFCYCFGYTEFYRTTGIQVKKGQCFRIILAKVKD